MLQGIYTIVGGLAKYTTLTGGLKWRFRMSFCLNKSLVLSEKQGFCDEICAETVEGPCCICERSGGGGGSTGGLTLRTDLQ